MPREYRPYREIKTDIEGKYKGLVNVVTNFGHEALSPEGEILYQVYDELDEATEFAYDEADFIENVRKTIADWHTERSRMMPGHIGSSERVKEMDAVTKKLRKYVRFNFPRQLWMAIPEFADAKKG